MHRTETLDYAICLKGECDLELDDGRTAPMKAGDICVQRGTMHAWVAKGSEPAVFAFVLIDAEPVEKGEKADDPLPDALTEALAGCCLGRQQVVLAERHHRANRLTVGIMAMVAEEDAPPTEPTRPPQKKTELGRRKAAEARQAKAASRTADLLPIVEAIRAEGITSATGIAKAMNERGIPTARGGRWQAVQVQRMLRSASG